MHARLATGAPDIDADIVAVGLVLLRDQLLRAVEEGEDRRLLLPRHVEEARDMSAWHDQDVTTREAVVVVAHVGPLVRDQNHVGLAELANIVRHRSLTQLETARDPGSACGRPG